MSLPHSLQWRVTLAYAALTIISLGLLSIYLVIFVRDSRIFITVALPALAVASLSMVLGYLLARRTSRSIRSVTEGARRLAAGDLEHRVQTLAKDETLELAESFNAMATALKDRISDLASDRTRLSAVLSTMADGVIVIEPAGRIALLNPAAERLLDLSTPEAVNHGFTEVIRDPDLIRLISQCLASEQQQHRELELLRQRRFLSAVATPLRGNGATGVLLTLHDLTRVRQVETTRKEFVSNVSHELRSPLSSVKALVETLEDGALEEAEVARNFLGRIQRDVDRMVGIVNDLLELSRLEDEQATRHVSPVDLRPLLEEAVTQFQEPAGKKGGTLKAIVPSELPPVLGEEAKLRQVLVNLLDNACKFTAAQGEVTLSATAEEGFVQVRVTDTGIGIAPEHLPHVFERFYKVDRARRDGGTGLGLAIVKHIIQAHKGEVSVQSQEGVGSTFTFSIPRSI